MTPFSFEWQWNVDYLVFMGMLYIALAIIACGLVYCLLKTWMDLPSEGESLEKPSTEISYRSHYSDY
jgi:hypothetical protein